MAEELAPFAKGLRVPAKAITDRFSADTVRALRGELFALEAFLRANPKAGGAKVRDALARAANLADTCHALTAELGGFESQKQKGETASLYDLGSIGVLALENILTADKITLPRILMNSLSEALMFLASRQYVAGSRDVLASLYRKYSASMYRELWTLATDHRRSMSAKDVRAAQEAIDAFFRRMEAEGVPVEARIAVLRQFYALLMTLRTADLLEALGR
jgi:hypothetical protein